MVEIEASGAFVGVVCITFVVRDRVSVGAFADVFNAISGLEMVKFVARIAFVGAVGGTRVSTGRTVLTSTDVSVASDSLCVQMVIDTTRLAFVSTVNGTRSRSYS